MDKNLTISFCFLFLCFSSNSDSTSSTSCFKIERTALLNFKADLSTKYKASGFKLSSWKLNNTDCCLWEGVTCHNITGHVISLDLNGFKLSGIVNITKLLDLSNLECLNLAFNEFYPSPFLSMLDLFSSLKYLNLSNSGFTGQVPKRIFLLPNLQVLDLSRNFGLYGTLPEFSGDSKLEILSVSYTGFYGKIPDSISGCRLLTELHLQGCNFSGLPSSSLGNMERLVYMDLSSNKFEGWIPFLPPLKKVTGVDETNHSWFLTKIKHLDIRNNSMEAYINSLLFTLPSLEVLLLSGNTLSGKVDLFERNSVSALRVMDLSRNNLDGPIPESFFELVNLTHLILHSNNFTSIASEYSFKSLEKLKVLDVSNNSRFTIPGSCNLTLPSLESLLLHSCNMTEFPGFLEKQDSLIELDLCNNKIRGKIPKWIWKQKLQHLNLGTNFLNAIEGTILVQSLRSLAFLDLSYNNLEGPIPNLPPSISFLSLAKNNFIGQIPPSVCNMSSLYFLDICYNFLNGKLPRCLGDISSLMVITLRENRLQGSMEWNFTNNCSLRTLSLYGNQIKGKIPESLQNCKSLQVLDLGNNQINDTFPSWLQKLRMLQILIFHSNKFHGPISDPATSVNFPMLHILDLSSNFFTGPLRLDFISKWSADMVNHSSESIEYMGGHNYREWVTITHKGLEMQDINILTIFSFLDLSNNQFQGKIPEMAGELKLLRLLNLSRNNLTGEIPTSLSKLTMLEALDISWNHLTGQIPMELTRLTFLAVLNLSYNRLEGSIPQQNQFSTFNNDSFEGNLGLCGLPLSRKCGAIEKVPSGTQQQDSLSSEARIEFEWMFALYGYGSGIVIGAVIGYIFSWRT